jgi:hypothetical protein
MLSTRVSLTLCCTLLLAGLAAQAQSSRKPGLYEVTSTISMGASSMPSGAQMPQNGQMTSGMQMHQSTQMPSASSPMGGPHTTQVCVTQAMIDKYGGPNPTPQHGTCQVTDIVLRPNSMKAKLSCTGQMDATGTFDSTWSADSSSKSISHLSGTMQMGNNSRPIDITVQATSVYKGPDCGAVKPSVLPSGK